MGSTSQIYQNTPRCVVRVGTIADWVGGSHDFNIFTIANACIRVTAFYGWVRVAATAANQIPIVGFTPTGGGAGTPIMTIMVAAGHAVDVMWPTDGLFGTVWDDSDSVGHSDTEAASLETILGYGTVFCPGVLEVTNGWAGAADATLEVDLYLHYIPLGPTATVVAN